MNDDATLVSNCNAEPLSSRAKPKGNLLELGLAISELSKCGQKQTMNHTVNICPNMKVNGGDLMQLHN